MRPDLVFLNVRVVTLDNAKPIAELVAVGGSRILWIGKEAEFDGLGASQTRTIDCGGKTLVPGFIDAHIHVMAYAASLVSVDCGPQAARSMDDIVVALAERATEIPPGQWVRGVGYDEFALWEGRHPTAHDLDRAAMDRPVRLDHRSGHATVLNSLAMECVGISTGTAEPPGGVIERDLVTGEPSGLLLEMGDYLDGRVPPLNETQLQRAVQIAGRRLASLGVTSVQDASHTNSPERWDSFARLKAAETFLPRVTMMPGSDYLKEFLGRGLRFGAGDADLNLGPAKIMLTMTAGALHPSESELAERIREAHDAGFPVAIHAVEADAVESAAETLLASRTRQSTGSSLRDRIEHCAECPPSTLDKLTRSGVAVVTQPGFIYHSGRRYLRQVPWRTQPWLYRVVSLREAGLVVAAGSDAPVTGPEPLVGIYAAVARRAATGETVGLPERVTATDALLMYTHNAAYAASQEKQKGVLKQGMLADMVLLDRDPTGVRTEDILEAKTLMTVIGGDIVWEG